MGGGAREQLKDAQRDPNLEGGGHGSDPRVQNGTPNMEKLGGGHGSNSKAPKGTRTWRGRGHGRDPRVPKGTQIWSRGGGATQLSPRRRHPKPLPAPPLLFIPPLPSSPRNREPPARCGAAPRFGGAEMERRTEIRSSPAAAPGVSDPKRSEKRQRHQPRAGPVRGPSGVPGRPRICEGRGVG